MPDSFAGPAPNGQQMAGGSCQSAVVVAVLKLRQGLAPAGGTSGELKAIVASQALASTCRRGRRRRNGSEAEAGA